MSTQIARSLVLMLLWSSMIIFFMIMEFTLSAWSECYDSLYYAQYKKTEGVMAIQGIVIATDWCEDHLGCAGGRRSGLAHIKRKNVPCLVSGGVRDGDLMLDSENPELHAINNDYIRLVGANDLSCLYRAPDITEAYPYRIHDNAYPWWGIFAQTNYGTYHPRLTFDDGPGCYGGGEFCCLPFADDSSNTIGGTVCVIGFKATRKVEFKLGGDPATWEPVEIKYELLPDCGHWVFDPGTITIMHEGSPVKSFNIGSVKGVLKWDGKDASGNPPPLGVHDDYYLVFGVKVHNIDACFGEFDADPGFTSPLRVDVTCSGGGGSGGGCGAGSRLKNASVSCSNPTLTIPLGGVSGIGGSGASVSLGYHFAVSMGNHMKVFPTQMCPPYTYRGHGENWTLNVDQRAVENGDFLTIYQGGYGAYSLNKADDNHWFDSQNESEVTATKSGNFITVDFGDASLAKFEKITNTTYYSLIEEKDRFGHITQYAYCT